MKFKRIASLILAAAMALSLAACGGQNDPGASGAGNSGTSGAATGEGTGHRDTLTIALTNEPQTLAPYSHSNQNGFIPCTLVFEQLIQKDADGNYQPMLAKEWEFIDDTTVKFVLRDDVKFHDGTMLDAEDVKFSLTNLAESSFTMNLFGVIDVNGFEIPDEHTIIVKLTQPYAPLEEALSSYRGAIVSKEAYEEMGEEEFGRNPVGTGPMKFSQWVSGDRIEFTKFDEYWGEPLAFDNCVARVIVEASSRTIELETGGIDLAFDLPISDWQRLEENPETQLIRGQTQGVTFITINNSIEQYQDLRVREAIAHAIDMEALVQTVWQGTATVADCYMAPSILGYKSEGVREFDPEKSKQLLAEAGYPDGIDVTYYTYENQINMTVAEVLQNMWAQAGIRMDLQIVDLATYTSLNNEGKIPVAHMNTYASIADPDAALLVWPLYRTISLRHNDQKVEDFLVEGKSIYDPTERAKVYNDMMDYLYQQCYTIPVAFPESAFGASADITNLPYAPNNTPDLTTIQFAN